MGIRRLLKIGVAVLTGTVATIVGRGQPGVTLRVGDEAPDFVLRGSDGRTHSLAELRGRRAAVVAWFPKAFTGG